MDHVIKPTIIMKEGQRKIALQKCQSSPVNASLQVSLYSQTRLFKQPNEQANEQAFKNCVLVGWKGEAALLRIAILPEFCQGAFPDGLRS